MEYYLKFWGGAESPILENLGIQAGDYWFDTKEQRDEFKTELRKYKDYGLVFKEEEGEADFVRKRTVVVIDAVFKGEKYHFEYDFGYAYEDEAAEYMFEDGNYACNCNLSNIIRDTYPDFPELDCHGDDEGNEIEYERFRIEHRD
jgi:hypothetical protein